MIAIIDYRAGNLTSVKRAFDSLGADCLVTSSPHEIATADKLVLPGVGHFSATRTLDELALRAPILDAIRRNIPFLGICVGMQWLFSGSSEAADCSGLGIFPGTCAKFSRDVKSPHVGWNTVTKQKDSRLLSGIQDPAFAYFTHSYRAPVSEHCTASTDHGGEFASVIEKDNVFGVQFHPEKSSATGLQILKNFIEAETC